MEPNQEPNEDRYQDDPHLEMGPSVFQYRHSIDLDIDDAPHMVTLVQEENRYRPHSVTGVQEEIPYSWISDRLAVKLHLQGTATKITVRSINSQDVVETYMAQLKLTLVHSGDTECLTFNVKPYVRKHRIVVNDFIDVDRLKQQYPRLEPIPLKEYSYANVEIILGQDMFRVILPLEYFETDRKSTPIAVRLPLGGVSVGPLHSTSELFSTCFKADTHIKSDFNLADEIRSCYDMELFGADKQVDPCPAFDARGKKI